MAEGAFQDVCRGLHDLLDEIPFRADFFPGDSNGIARTIAFPNGVWERGKRKRRKITALSCVISSGAERYASLNEMRE